MCPSPWPHCPPCPHLCLGQLGPIGLQVVDDAAQRAGQRHAVHQQQDEDHVGEQRREVDDLQMGSWSDPRGAGGAMGQDAPCHTCPHQGRVLG